MINLTGMAVLIPCINTFSNTLKDIHMIDILTGSQ
jgi:hypothetical protein